MIRRLWKDEAGGTLTTEVMLLATLLVIGLIVGAKSFRDAAVSEWADYGQAIANWDQSYNIPDSTTLSGIGSGFVDLPDFCDTSADNNNPTLSSNGAFTNPPSRFIRYGVAPLPER